jgi:hypothetical protein
MLHNNRDALSNFDITVRTDSAIPSMIYPASKKADAMAVSSRAFPVFLKAKSSRLRNIRVTASAVYAICRKPSYSIAASDRLLSGIDVVFDAEPRRLRRLRGKAFIDGRAF